MAAPKPPVTRDIVTVAFDESRLTERNAALSVLLRLSNVLAGATDLGELLHGALEVVCGHFQLDAARLYLLDSETNTLVLKASRGLDPAGLEIVHMDEGFSGRSARNRCFIAQNVSDLTDRKRGALLRSKGLKVVVCVPMIVLDRVEGVMNLSSRGFFELDPEKIDLLMVMGHQIGAAVANARIMLELSAKLDKVREQSETIKFFAYSVSHDLKSPAVGLYGLTKRLKTRYGGSLDETGRLYCDQILKAAERIVTLVEQINTYVTAREVPRPMRKVSLKSVLSGLRDEFSMRIRERGVRWVEPQVLPEVAGDEMLLTRAVQNLIDNALKHGGEELREIRFEWRENERSYILGISDDGAGIREEQRARLFQPFHRGAAKGVEGTGLGLAILKEVAKRHGGEAWVESEPGRGTTFFFSISKKPDAACRETGTEGSR
ncbi:MAG: ATP-binding protein [Thermodesulfobacteriota bacterium]|nr:ATP-binding protein [Thermodesulfobacteriota bacterium]